MIKNAYMTRHMSTNIRGTLESFTNVEQITISDPTKVEQFPQLASIGCLKLENIPPKSDDWLWLKSVQGLVEIYISVSGKGKDQSTLEVRESRVKLRCAPDPDTVSTLAKALSNLPMNVSYLDLSVHAGGTETPQLCVDCSKVEIINVDKEEMADHILDFFSHLPDQMRDKVRPYDSQKS